MPSIRACIAAPAGHRCAMPPPSDLPPDAASLREAALTYLARYAATEVALRRVLAKRLERWGRTQTSPEDAASVMAAAREAIEHVITTLVGAGAVNDTGFAQGRAYTLQRSGRSRLAIKARLLAKGV